MLDTTRPSQKTRRAAIVPGREKFHDHVPEGACKTGRRGFPESASRAFLYSRASQSGVLPDTQAARLGLFAFAHRYHADAMTENVENLILEHLRALRAGQDRMTEALMQLTLRVGSLETQVASLHKSVVSLHEDMAIVRSRIDVLSAP